MRKSRVTAALAVVASLSLALAACGGSSNKDAQQAKSGPTSVTVGWNQPFYSYNDNSTTGNNVTNANIRYMTNGQFYYYDADSELKADTELRHLREDQRQPAHGQVHRQQGRQVVRRHAVRRRRPAAQLGRQQRQRQHGRPVTRSSATRPPARPSPPATRSTSTAPPPRPGQSLALVKATPKLSDNNQTLTLVYTQPYADWKLDMGPIARDLPAHVIGMKALGISDPTKAKDAVVKAIENKDAASLSKIANFWNTGFDYTSLPSDKSLYLSSVPTWSPTSRRTATSR